MESFTVQFAIDARTYADIIRRRLWRSGRVITSLALTLLASVLFYFAKQPLVAVVFPLAMAGVICFRVWCAPVRWLKTTGYLTEERNLKFTPDRLFFETASVKSEFPWTQFVGWSETRDFFTLDLTKSGYCSVIPKTAMTDDEQEQFREWAGANFPV